MGTKNSSSQRKHELADLQKFYTDGEGADSEIFAEMRSNILLYAGDHYTKKSSSFFKRVRDTKELNSETKLRLTKNHTQYICDTYVNNIVAPNPGVGFTPKNEKELHDQKVADMHHAVWRDAHEKYNIDDKIDDWADSFVQIGEVATKIYFDTTKGRIKAYDQLERDGELVYLDENGEETFEAMDAMGLMYEPAPDMEKPLHEGEFCFDEIYGFNLLRPAECKDMAKAEWLGERKMVDIIDLQKRFPDHADDIKSSMDETYTVFDSSKGGYVQVSGQVMVMEYYFRPCAKYPAGYYYITTREAILADGELPGGVFPIVYQAFRKFATTPRGRSAIKTMRPYQAEINRSASKMAEHQITLGDDKILVQNGTTISNTVALPGIRGVSITGADPKILPGRDGSQYLNYMTNQIAEMYQVLGVADDMADAPNAQQDPYVMLFRSARSKKKFQRYIKRFEKFLINVVKTYLALAKVHFTDDMLIYAIGKAEQVNIPEFRSQEDLCYEIKVEAQSEDMEDKLGKQITLTHALQYIGNRLAPEDLGMIMAQMPYANLGKTFQRMTQKYDNSVNCILALDRGEKPPINQYEDHVFMIQELTTRMNQADFSQLAPQIQQAYQQKVVMHQNFEAQRQMAVQRAQQGMIPTGGYMTKCDLYVPGETADSAPKRLTINSEALQWLVKQIEVQQAGLAPLAGLPGQAQGEIANQFTRMGGAGPSAGSPMGSPQAAMNMASSFPRAANS